MTFDQFPSNTLFGSLSPEEAAVFLDFDGVLVDLAEGPKQIHVPRLLPRLLGTLGERTSGALAVVTGRAIGDLAGHLGELPHWVAGSHGGERVENGKPAPPHAQNGSQAVIELQSEVLTLELSEPGVELEMKPLGAVLHFRKAPQMKDTLHAFAQDLADRHDGFECHAAKMAFELRPTSVGKDRVVRDWMMRPPFEGRVPVYFGDDLTDEPAMAWVQDAGGIAIKVGPGDSVAKHRVERPKDVLAHLAKWVSD
jgi:trehalose 6-phosphate phosphatase